MLQRHDTQQRTATEGAPVSAEAESVSPNLDAELAELTACMEASIARNKRRARRRNRVGISLDLGCVVGIVAWTYAVLRGVMSADTMPMAVAVFMIVIPVAVLIGGVKWTGRDYIHSIRLLPDVVNRLILRDDARVVGPLLDAFYLYAAFVKPAFWQTMGRLLPRMTADEILQLGKERHGRLATWIAGWDRPGNRMMFAGAGPGARVHLGGPRQCLRVDILPDVRQFAISNGNCEDPMVLERPIRGYDSPLAKPTTRTRSPCAMNSGGSGYEISTVSEAF
ncbi:MAG: hypothetical protein JWL77_6731 [Chthonomonadaceae bacterium]|nr:hypothetical protein [Chthonomonadaceae bacterium]